MKITFCGHSSFVSRKEYNKTIMELLERLVGNNSVEFLLGGYGGFDNFAYECCKNYKKIHPSASLVFVTPYLNESYNRTRLVSEMSFFDDIIYPPLENVPQKFAIIYRNRYMIDTADIVISYISHSFGGAYQTYAYALKKKKTIFNIYKKDL